MAKNIFKKGVHPLTEFKVGQIANPIGGPPYGSLYKDQQKNNVLSALSDLIEKITREPKNIEIFERQFREKYEKDAIKTLKSIVFILPHSKITLQAKDSSGQLISLSMDTLQSLAKGALVNEPSKVSLTQTDSLGQTPTTVNSCPSVTKEVCCTKEIGCSPESHSTATGSVEIEKPPQNEENA